MQLRVSCFAGRLMKKSIVLAVVFQRYGLSGNPLFFHCPFSQVYQFTTLGAEGFGELFWNPGHRTAAVGAFYDKRFVGCRHQKRQQVKAKGMSSGLCDGLLLSEDGTMKRMVQRCLPPLISAKQCMDLSRLTLSS